jgi:hypothetical protein
MFVGQQRGDPDLAVLRARIGGPERRQRGE